MPVLVWMVFNKSLSTVKRINGLFRSKECKKSDNTVFRLGTVGFILNIRFQKPFSTRFIGDYQTSAFQKRKQLFVCFKWFSKRYHNNRAKKIPAHLSGMHKKHMLKLSGCVIIIIPYTRILSRQIKPFSFKNKKIPADLSGMHKKAHTEA